MSAAERFAAGRLMVPRKLAEVVVQSMEREKPRDPKANATSFKKGRAKTGGRKPGTQTPPRSS